MSSVNKTISNQTSSREEEAERTLARTKVSRLLAGAITFLFLLLIFSVPIVQHFNGPPPGKDHRPFSSLFPAWQEIISVTHASEIPALLPTEEESKEVEKNLETDSLLSQYLLSRSQNVMSQFFLAGNEQVYMTPNRWLFSKVEIDYLTGKGFLDSAVLQRAKKEGIQGDPIKAIADFQRQLQARGITLIVMPVPSKATIHSEEFGNSANGSTLEAPENASYAAFEAELKRRKILVYHPGPALLRAKKLTREPQYFPRDTHWTPQAMTRVARDLSAFIRENVELPAREKTVYSFETAIETNICDLEIMLKLPKDQRIFPRQQAVVQRVVDDQGKLWKPRTDADILLLGDSFSNIYSRGGYWGEAAGLGEHLSYYLQRPVDRIGLNGGAASMIRRRWQSDLERKTRDAKNVRVVIYEFATRTLKNNDWEIIDFSSALTTSNSDKIPPPSAMDWILDFTASRRDSG